jgi:uncharacterized membrane protein (UPF0127 family)
MFCLFLTGCLGKPAANSQEPVNSSGVGQMLPISAQAIIGQTIIELEVATTPEQQALGLMFREQLPANRGMLFPFSQPRFPQFWMKNVLIPLDMIFLKEGVVQAVYFHVPGCQQDPCPIYAPNRLADQVIELAGGRAKELGVQVGDRISLKILK